METNTDVLAKFEKTTREMNDYMHEQHRSAFARYPLVFSLLGTFGVAAILYGFEETLHVIPLFRDQPWVTLLVGIAVLVFTGTLYKRIDRHFE